MQDLFTFLQIFYKTFLPKNEEIPIFCCNFAIDLGISKKEIRMFAKHPTG